MKIVEALKSIKDLKRKADDLREKVKMDCALSSLDTPKYPDQKRQVSEWIQAHSDILKEISRLKIALMKTNTTTPIAIELGGKQVTKTIAEWVIRRRELAKEELAMWSVLSDRGIKEGMGTAPGGQPLEIKIVRFYDPAERDKKKELFASEPSVIDGRLEVANAITDLIEA
jgi:hypothetical protein